MLRKTISSTVSVAGRVGAWLASGTARVYGSIFPTSRVQTTRGLRIYTGLPHWAYPRGGVCVGNVFLTGPMPSSALIDHELVHSRQWNRYGLAFPLLYAAAGANPLTNRFEIEAGLESGGYAQKQGNKRTSSDRSLRK